MRRRQLLALAMGLAGAGAGQAAPVRSLRPRARVSTRVAAEQTEQPMATASPEFRRWLRSFRARAHARGLPPAVLDRALDGLTPDPEVIRRDRSQGEFTRQIWEYLDRAVSEERIAAGRAAMARHHRTLGAIERRFAVDAEIITAIWGLESAYGTHRGRHRVIRSLATLAHDGRRRRFFEGELMAALRILAAGDVSPERMLGSWAGAMGHTQFMPSSYLAFAVDFTGDGRRDIWSDDPTDALASTANYLARHGWRPGLPWGVEVRLPADFDWRLAGERIWHPRAFWAARGLRPLAGGRLPAGELSIRAPAGARGPVLAITRNFTVIERYNPADAYVIAVGHLADRLRGRGPLRTAWPRGDRPLSASQRRELQARLTRAGFPTGGIDGIIGPNTIDAIRRFQAANGMVPDGYPSLRLLQHLGGG